MRRPPPGAAMNLADDIRTISPLLKTSASTIQAAAPLLVSVVDRVPLLPSSTLPKSSEAGSTTGAHTNRVAGPRPPMLPWRSTPSAQLGWVLALISTTLSEPVGTLSESSASMARSTPATSSGAVPVQASRQS